ELEHADREIGREAELLELAVVADFKAEVEQPEHEVRPAGDRDDIDVLDRRIRAREAVPGDAAHQLDGADGSAEAAVGAETGIEHVSEVAGGHGGVRAESDVEYRDLRGRGGGAERNESERCEATTDHAGSPVLGDAPTGRWS